MKQKLATLKYNLIKFLRRHQAFVIASLILLVCAVVITRIAIFNTQPINQDRIDDATRTLQSVRFDQDAIKKWKCCKKVMFVYREQNYQVIDETLLVNSILVAYL